MLTYRTLAPDEQDQVIRLWATVLEDSVENRRRIFCDFAADPQRFARTYVAVASDGSIHAAMSYWVRDLHNRQGQVQHIGHLWGAATEPAFRYQGHATQLATRLLAAMQAEGCHWSLLFAREEARSLYTHLGWQGFSTLYRGGLVAADQLPTTTTYTIHAYDPLQAAQGWEPLINVYAEYNRSRPLSFVRSNAYWQGYISWMAGDWLTNHCATYLVATPATAPEIIDGYALVHFYDATYAQAHFGSSPWFHVSEIAVRRPDVTQALLAGVAAQALAQGMGYGQVALPQEESIDHALHALLAKPLNTESVQGSMMARPLATDMTMADLEALFASPGAWLWEIDRF